MEEDRYDAWLDSLRQRLRDDYLAVLDRLSDHSFDQRDYDTCVTLCSNMLAVDACHEAAHRRLMCCYNRLGHPFLALRQYHTCVEMLAQELEASPSAPTHELYERIRHGQSV